MESQIADRIIELAAKWQTKGNWDIAYGQAGNFQQHRAAATKDWEAFNLELAALRKVRGLDDRPSRTPEDWEFIDEQLKSNPEGMLAEFQHGARRNEELSEMSHKYVIDANRELLELKSLVTEHAPRLLKLFPDFDFFTPPDDRRPWLNIREIESEIRFAIAPKWSPAGTMRRWEEWFKLANCAGSEDTIERRIAEGTFTAKQPREKARLILDINKLPLEMQSEEFWKRATTPQ